MSRKNRVAWEAGRRHALNVRNCKNCGRWGDTPSLEQVADGIPVACDLITSEEIFRYEMALDMPDYEVLSHRIHMMFTPDEPCGEDCKGIKQSYRSGMGGLSLIERIKMSSRIEDTAGAFTELRGNKTLTGKCFLHNEQRGESFVIWTEPQLWKCYGKCNVGGDYINLIMECKKRGLNWKMNNPDIEKLLRR